MAKCCRCGAETALYDCGFPICIRCAAEHEPDRQQTQNILRGSLETAKKRREEASSRLAVIMRDVPSGIPSPDGAERIQRASRELQDAIAAYVVASRRLSDFLSGGTAPADLDVGKAQGGK